MNGQCGRSFRVACWVGLAATSVGRVASTQGQKGRINGRVVDKASLAPVIGAHVVLLPEGLLATTDSMGLYAFGGRSPGTFRVLVRALPYVPSELDVQLKAANVAVKDFELDSAAHQAQSLDAVAINAAAKTSYRLADFERRRKTGAGHYRDDADIQKSGAANIQDLTRGMRGVDIHCGGGDDGCQIQMSRAPMNCPPDYVVDGHIDHIFGPSTPIRDVVGFEVYTGPSDVPGEFAGRSAGCGVVVIWTRSGPPARSKP